MIYALGGGTGHWTRAISLARQAAKHGIATRILTNSSTRPPLASEPEKVRDKVTSLIRLDPKIDIIQIPAIFDREKIMEISRRELSTCQAQDVLIVDSFPCGIAGELRETLGDISAQKVFIHRDLKPEYIHWGKLEDFVRHYDLVISPGETGALEHFVHARTSPWLVCDADELVPRAIARKVFGVDENSQLPLIAVSGCGTSDESLEMAKFALNLHGEFGSSCHVRLTSLEERAVREAGEIGVSLWPLLAVLPAVDLLVGAGGYHTVYESRLTQTPFFAMARDRLYDRQSHRLRSTERAANHDDLTRKIGNFLVKFIGTKTELPQPYTNGASKAFEIIAGTQIGSLKERRPV
ncbi:MAG: hypothetical protein WCH39_15995 [Schlesneria sp.]